MITPIEIQKTEFKMSAHGYSKQQVDEFKEIILKDYETLYRQSLDLNEKIDQLTEKISYYENMEKSLHKALVLAEKSAEETKKTAASAAKRMDNRPGKRYNLSDRNGRRKQDDGQSMAEFPF